ncbi:MAG TPA: hypothetical protein ENN19_04000, partial [Chloroflexi bacterium]|nr:hypothetical protein [Chloroflexota bacterium]
KIGLVAPFEGRYRYVGYDVIYAVRLAIREVNAAGGVGGYGVELVAYDDGADPAMAMAQARKLAVDDDVVAALGHFREETTAAAAPVYGEAGIPLVAPVVRGDLANAGIVCRMGPSAETVADAWLDYLVNHEMERAALLTEGGPPLGPLGEALTRRASARGVRVAPVVALDSIDANEERSVLMPILDAGIDVLFCDANPVMAGEVIAALRAAGWTGAFVGGPDLAAGDFTAIAGTAARGTTFVTPWPRLDEMPGGQSFVEAYRAISNGSAPGSLALPAYEATWILLEALARDIAAHGAPSRAGVAAALPVVKREGRLGMIAFDVDARGCRWQDAPLYWRER